jgi:hypothetical protein
LWVCSIVCHITLDFAFYSNTVGNYYCRITDDTAHCMLDTMEPMNTDADTNDMQIQETPQDANIEQG